MQCGSGQLLEALYFSKRVGEGEALLFKRSGRALIPLGAQGEETINSLLKSGLSFEVSNVRTVREGKDPVLSDFHEQLRRDIASLRQDYAARLRAREGTVGFRALITYLTKQLKKK